MEMERSECVSEFQDLIKYWIWGEEKPSNTNKAQIYDKQDGMNAWTFTIKANWKIVKSGCRRW